MDLLGLELEGVSVGGLETCLELPQWKVAVDLGAARRGCSRFGTVLITHPHADHLGAVATHLARRGLLRLGPPTYVVPPEVAGDLEDLVAVWRRLDRARLRCTIRGLAPGEPLELTPQLTVRPFRTVHRVVSQGYLFSTTHKRLAPEHVGRSPQELAALRRAGEVIDHFEQVDELAITGDTRIEGVLRHADVLQARRLVIEVTFLDDQVPAETSREMGHIHLDEVIEHADAFASELVCISHISPRYKDAEIDAILDARLPPDLRARTVWFR